ncbi:sensor histidine kinase [Nocardioides sp. CER19]|uniref:sensor histidine kinase n=1 Tax=Nocardioides sp. CER19 TaxID=3038538 RepID=UPI002448388A|nr:sensor histidine kinase [Nocardioides sp. CER19]MDH2415438.1 sensor histidine kinase [Nocardioides sp. CER19]
MIRTRRLALGTQAVVALAVLLSVVVLLSLGVSAAVVRHDLETQYEQRALAIARSVAALPGLGRQVATATPTPDGAVELEAEGVRRRTGALYVVVTDAQGIRFSHPTLGNIGRPVSTSPDAALSGREVVTVEQGTLGYSARGKVPLRDDSGRIVGEVSVGIAMSEVAHQAGTLTAILGVIALGALALGLLGALTLARRLRRTTLGLQPEEMADLVREHVAVLGGVRDGVVAVDGRGRVTVSNPEARRLLGSELTTGVRLCDTSVAPESLALFEEEPAPSGALRLLGGRVVVVTRLPVQRGQRDLGTVLILRDRTDLDEMAGELEATRALTDALRAQAHEHNNRLHALMGMLHRGDVDAASSYLTGLSDAGTWLSGVDDPYLAGLLAAKSATASEAGVLLRVSDGTWLDRRVAHPLDTVTVVGNLIDNGIGAAARGDRLPRSVDVTLLADGPDLLVHVVDSGAGVAAEHAEQVFQRGFTTREGDGTGHGLGLALARHTARAHGGDVRLVSRRGPDSGAAFEARLAGVLNPSTPVAGERR